MAKTARKSTEEGLDQEFNSLDAQRESGEAFIASLRTQGWNCLPNRYDDGGFTGANIERPALRRLLDDIEQGKIDAVVVYKVDRLSRSLLDFARMMEVFERRSASRKQRRWTQKELASKVGVRFEQLNKYEMGLNCPPFEKLLTLADALGVSIDFLVVGTPSPDHALRDTRLLSRFEAVQDFDHDDQEAIIALLDAMIVKHRVRGAVAPIDKPKRAANG